MRIPPKAIKQVYDGGQNVMAYLRSLGNSAGNSLETILLSYECQSGSYMRKYFHEPERYHSYAKELADELNELASPDCSIMEVGCGEALWLALMPRYLRVPARLFGFDISWSRLKFGEAFFKHLNPDISLELFAADLFRIPLPDNSIDIVYTSHSIEPNTGREKEALAELYRVARRYVVLSEPAYEFADAAGRARMKEHGYITRLWETVESEGYAVREHRPVAASFNPLNPTGLTIIEKESSNDNDPTFVCPVTHTPLFRSESFLYSEESRLAYPVFESIPMLQEELGIVAIHWGEDFAARVADAARDARDLK